MAKEAKLVWRKKELFKISDPKNELYKFYSEIGKTGKNMIVTNALINN